MIVVYTADMERLVLEDATRYKTDEHNNLEVLTGRQGDKPVGLFNAPHWNRVLIEDGLGDDDDDDQD